MSSPSTCTTTTESTDSKKRKSPLVVCTDLIRKDDGRKSFEFATHDEDDNEEEEDDEEGALDADGVGEDDDFYDEDLEEDFDEEDVADGSPSAKRRVPHDRLQRCRERNRIHARNTRERKKAQMDVLQSRVQQLMEERDQLQLMAVDSSVAGILMSMAGAQRAGLGVDDDGASHGVGKSSSSRNDLTTKLEELQRLTSKDLPREEASDIDFALLSKNKAECSPKDLELIRKEVIDRNITFRN
jgi:hypothetical protein